MKDSNLKNILVGLAIATTVTLWGSAFVGIRISLGSYSPQVIALLRYLTASAGLLIYAVVTRMPLPDLEDIPRLALMGFLGITFYNVALNAGEQTVPAGTASLIIASETIFVALLAAWLLNEKLRGWGWFGIVLSFVGVALIAVEPGEQFGISIHALYILGSSISAAFFLVGQKPLLEKYSALQFTTYAIWLGTIMLLIFTPALVRQLPTAELTDTLAVVYMGIFPGAIGYISWAYVMSKRPASTSSSFLYLIPIVATLIGWLILGELPRSIAFLGGALILAGVILVNSIGREKVEEEYITPAS